MNARIPRSITLALAAALWAGAPAWAEKPEGAGKGKEQKESKHKDKDKSKGELRVQQADRPAKSSARDTQVQVRIGGHFSDQHRVALRSYYGDHYGGSKGCPPGLAKKNNGCMPPGQAKKWAVGQPLPVGVTIYPVPQAVIVQLPPVPVGYKYVRVATDILLIAVGTQMVVDGISDLMRL